MNFLKKFIGSTSTDEVVSLPSGKLFLTRSPLSPKGELECLYNDAFASIRQTTTAFYYRLLITRVYQEGEINSNGGDGFDDLDDDYDDDGGRGDLPHSITDSQSGTGSKDEYGFVVSEELKIHLYDKDDGSRAISWKDLNGDLGDRFEFVIDQDCRQSDVDLFMFALYKCQYEQKYHKSSLNITSMSQLKEFIYNPKMELLTFEDLNKNIWAEEEDDDEEEDEVEEEEDDDDQRGVEADEEVSSDSSDSDSEFHDAKAGVELVWSNADIDLYIFDPETENFHLFLEKPQIKLIDAGDWKYYISIKGGSNEANGVVVGGTSEILILKDITPVFNYEFLSFVYNYQVKSTLNSYLMKFKDFDSLSEFQAAFSTLLFQSHNKAKFVDTKADMEYITNALGSAHLDDDLNENDLAAIEGMSDDVPEIEEKEEIEDEDEDEEHVVKRKGFKPKSALFVDSDDDEEEISLAKFKHDKTANSNLSVGFANDRSYVVRGDKLGVFKNSDDDLSFQTTISDLTTLDGKRFIPMQTMLHMQDRYMVMQGSADDSKLFKMDLERGKIIEEWDVAKDQTLKSFGPNSKYSQLTNEQTLTGISANGMFKIDPRLSTKEKLVEDKTFKLYKTKNNDFLSFATTQEGFIAVGSKRGDIRLYDRLGANAKTALPSLGEPINYTEVSADGRWILGTCESYLILIDAKIGEGQKNLGNLGFNKYFDKDKKPKPRLLCIKPEHAAYIYNETGKNISFTKAHFNTGLTTKESTIVTSTGPYVITWSLKQILTKPKVKKGTNPISSTDIPYRIERYNQNVMADNFKFGSNADVILALKDDVTMTNKKEFKRPSKNFFVDSNKHNVVEEY